MEYSKGKVYKILNNKTPDVYVGSTCQKLSKRLANHKTRLNEGKETLLYNKMRELGDKNFYIELVEDYPCENGEQLKRREGEVIREIGTLNEKIAGRTKQEYNDENRESKNCKERERYNNNKEERQQKHREKYAEMTKIKITCGACGGVHNKKNTPNHRRSKRHQQALENLNDTNGDVSLQTDH